MKFIGEESTYSSSKKTSEKDQTGKEDNSKDDTKTVEVAMFRKTGTMSVRYSITASTDYLNVAEYHQMDLNKIAKNIEEIGILLGDFRLSYVFSSHVSFNLYGFNSSLHTLSVIVSSKVSNKNVTSPLNSCIAVFP